MNSTQIDDGIIDDIFVDGDDSWRPDCGWDETYCPERATYRVCYKWPCEPNPAGSIDLLCPRHYALALARMASVHSTWCHVPVSKHFTAYGPTAW